MEQLAENLSPLCRICQKELLKVPLGDHGDLGELPIIKAQDLLHSPGHLTRLCHRLPAVIKIQLRPGRLGRNTLAPFLGTHVFGIPADPVALSMA